MFMLVLLQKPVFEIDGTWRRSDRQDPEALTGLDRRGIGIDFVAR